MVERLSKAEMERILETQKVDVGERNLFGPSSLKNPADQRLTLIISVGGSGRAAAEEAIRLANRRMWPQYNYYVKFIVVDTAREELERLARRGISTLDISCPDAFDSQAGILHDRIQSFFANEWVNKVGTPVDLIILTDAKNEAFTDIAAIAKAACPHPEIVHTYGFIMLPVTADRFPSNASMQHSAIDTPILISGDCEQAIPLIAESIVNALMSHNGSFILQELFNGAHLSGHDQENSHMYSGIGFAQAGIPEKTVIPYVIGEAAGKLYIDDPAQNMTAFCSDRKRLARPDFENAVKVLFGLRNDPPLKPDSLWRYRIYPLLRKCSVLRPNCRSLSFEELIEDGGRKYAEGYNIPSTVATALGNLQSELGNLYFEFIQNAKQVMKIHGPRAIEYLYRGTGEIDPNTYMEEDLTEISIRTQMEYVLRNLQILAGTEVKYPPKLENNSLFQRMMYRVDSGKLRTSENEIHFAAQQEVYVHVAKQLSGAYGMWQSEFTEKIDEFYRVSCRFADVLDTMTGFYKNQGKYLGGDDFYNFARYCGNGSDGVAINLCSDQRTYNWVRGRCQNKINSISPAALKDTLIDDFFRDSDRWLSDETGVARKQFDACMGRACGVGVYASKGKGLGLGWTEWIDEMLIGVAPALIQNILDNQIRVVMDRLFVASKPALALQPGKELSTKKIILIPVELVRGAYGSQIRDVLERYGWSGDRIIESPSADMVMCYQSVTEVPAACNGICASGRIGIYQSADR